MRRGHGVNGKSLYLPLYFDMNLKLFFKKKNRIKERKAEVKFPNLEQTEAELSA